MDDIDLEKLAGRLGLATVWRLYPEEIRTAVANVAASHAELAAPLDEALAPYPLPRLEVPHA